MVSFELGKEIEKDVFCLVMSVGQRKNSLFVQLLVPTSSTMSRNLLVKYLNAITVFDLRLSTKTSLNLNSGLLRSA